MNDDSAVEFLERRRSVSALKLTAPGPDEACLARLLAIAARVPDHGKLAPWRFLVIDGAAKDRLAQALGELAELRPDVQRAKAAAQKLALPPLCVAVISQVKESPIPEWEQILSAGAVCMNLLTAALAMGWGANWITGWYAYENQALQFMGLEPNERIAGFIPLGTATDAPLERPRPDIAKLTTRLR